MANIEQLRRLHSKRELYQKERLEKLIEIIEVKMIEVAPYFEEVIVIFPQVGWAYGEHPTLLPSQIIYSVSREDEALCEYLTEQLSSHYAAEGFSIRLDKQKDLHISWAC